MTETIGIFGVSGVGKSTLINNFITVNPDWEHLQAGELIRKELKNVDHDKLRLEGTEAILKNQYLMIDAFWREIKNKDLSKVFFDGHSVIDTGKELLPIPADVIGRLKPARLFFVSVDPEIILQRRLKDISRNRPILSQGTIERQQNKALEQFRIYEEKLSIPTILVRNPKKDALGNLV